MADWQFANGTEDHPGAVAGLLERFPREVFPALTDPLLLGFAEAVMGPFVQLDSFVLNGDPPVSPDQYGQPVMWHRDRFGSVPPGVYVRPASIVFLSYLQQTTDAVGPLRVLPGSHRSARLLAGRPTSPASDVGESPDRPTGLSCSGRRSVVRSVGTAS